VTDRIVGPHRHYQKSRKAIELGVKIRVSLEISHTFPINPLNYLKTRLFPSRQDGFREIRWDHDELSSDWEQNNNGGFSVATFGYRYVIFF